MLSTKQILFTYFTSISFLNQSLQWIMNNIWYITKALILLLCLLSHELNWKCIYIGLHNIYSIRVQISELISQFLIIIKHYTIYLAISLAILFIIYASITVPLIITPKLSGKLNRLAYKTTISCAKNNSNDRLDMHRTSLK